MCCKIVTMESVKIVIFDEEELTQTLIENYLKEVIFPYEIEKYNEFDVNLLKNYNGNQIAIVNLNTYNTDILEKISEFSKSKNTFFLIISYNTSTDLQVRALRNGVKDYIVKPLLKADFVYSVQQIYKHCISEQNNKKSYNIYSIYSSSANTEEAVFAYNLAKEVENIIKDKVLLIDFPSAEKNISSILNLSLKLASVTQIDFKDNIQQFEASMLYILNLKDEIITDKSFLYEILKGGYKYIFINAPCIQDKTVLNEISDTIIYVINSNECLYDRIKDDICSVSQNKKIYTILNSYDSSDYKKTEHIQSLTGMEVSYKIPENYVTAEKAITNRTTLNKINPNADISRMYVKIARDIVSR